MYLSNIKPLMSQKGHFDRSCGLRRLLDVCFPRKLPTR
jgi:hypothetical protein